MDSRQERVLQTFRRILGWFAANLQYVAKAYPASLPVLAEQRDALNGIVSRATEYVTQQNAQFAHSTLTSKDEHDKRTDLLKNHMMPINKVARALKGRVPGIGVLLVPKGLLNTATLISTAVEMARKSEAYQTVLVQHGLPTDFVKQLNDAAAALKECAVARGQARAVRVGSSEGIKIELARGTGAQAVMDAILSNVLRSDPAKLAEWKQLQRVVRKGRGVIAARQRTTNAVQASTSAGQATAQAVQETQPVRQASESAGQTSTNTVQRAPSTVQASISTGQAAPSTGQAMPNRVQTTPSSVQVTPSVVQMTPNSVQVTPSAVQVTPGAVQVTPNAGQPTSSNTKKVA